MINNILREHNVIFLTKFGSHLYGTDTPESDTDYKGVFIPPLEQILLGNVPKQLNFDSNTSNEKNSREDVDCQLYSLHYFLELLRKGETVAIDMLHAVQHTQHGGPVVYYSHLWSGIYAHREAFYTRNMKAFMGYCRKQAAKYGMKGSRINSAQKLLDFLDTKNEDQRLSEFWVDLPTDEHLTFATRSHSNPGIKQFNFCGKILQETIKVGYAKDMIQTFLDKYGDRARKAANNEEVDWKAMSHALRAALQLEEIYTTGDLKYPLTDATYLTEVKQGLLDFTSDVLPELEAAIVRVEKLAEESTYPGKVNQRLIESLILGTLDAAYGTGELM